MFEQHRFKTTSEDYRPVKFPPPGPYWCTGYSDDYAIIVAIFPKGTDVKEFWPEAENIDTAEVVEITYTNRFPKPEWMTEHDVA